MADLSVCPPLTPESITTAHDKIKPYIHQTPLISSRTLNAIASSPNPSAFLSPVPPSPPQFEDTATLNNQQYISVPRFLLHFKLESQQKIGAFKARGAYHAILHLISSLGLLTLQSRGVITHSSGNHAQALALAASTFSIPAFIVMPIISTPSKIQGTRMYTDHVIFSGSTSTEREATVAEVQSREVGKGGGSILVPPYDHPDIVLGQGTTGREMELQFQEAPGRGPDDRFDAVITPLGGGGLLSGTATWFSHTDNGSNSSVAKAKKTLVFGAEPSFSGANDAQIGLSSNPPKRVPHVSSLTIADGLRTPVGEIPWSIISDKTKIEGVYSVTEREIKMALRLMMERVKLWVEPSAVVGVAVVLFCQEFREFVRKRQETELKDTGKLRPWDVGLVLSGGNTTVEAVGKLFAEMEDVEDESRADVMVNGARQTGEIGMHGEKKVEDIAG